MDNIAPEMQGRVFAANSLVVQSVSAIATLIAGPLADQRFEPAMMSGGRLAHLLGPLFGHSAGAGMAVLYTACSVALLLIGIGGFFISSLKAIETTLTNHQA